MIDIHCHLLPGLDDGAADLDEALEMARIAVEDGIHTVVCTPHALNGKYINPFDTVLQTVAAFRRVLESEGIPLNLLPGADVHLRDRMLERIESGEAGTIGGKGKYILIEFPSQALPPGYGEALFKLTLEGVTPIITHPERNLVLQNERKLLFDLIAAGCLMQVTGASVTGEFGEAPMDTAHFMLRHRMVHVIASDGHSVEGRPPRLARAVAAAANVLNDAEAAQAMVTVTPAAIIAGDRVAVPDPIAETSRRKKWWQFF